MTRDERDLVKMLHDYILNIDKMAPEERAAVVLSLRKLYEDKPEEVPTVAKLPPLSYTEFKELTEKYSMAGDIFYTPTASISSGATTPVLLGEYK